MGRKIAADETVHPTLVLEDPGRIEFSSPPRANDSALLLGSLSNCSRRLRGPPRPGLRRKRTEQIQGASWRRWGARKEDGPGGVREKTIMNRSRSLDDEMSNCGWNKVDQSTRWGGDKTSRGAEKQMGTIVTGHFLGALWEPLRVQRGRKRWLRLLEDHQQSRSHLQIHEAWASLPSSSLNFSLIFQPPDHKRASNYTLE